MRRNEIRGKHHRQAFVQAQGWERSRPMRLDHVNGERVAWGVWRLKNLFSSHFLSSSSWANTHLNRGMLSGENVQSLLYKCTFGGCHKNETGCPLGSWGLYVIMDKGGRGAGVCDFEGEIGSLQVFKTELMCSKQIPAGNPGTVGYS